MKYIDELETFMRYIQIQNPGPDSQVLITEGPKPIHTDSQLLVRVYASALNRADLMQRAGKYPPPPGESEVPGLELAGEVVAVGANVENFKLGDRVYGLVGSGAFSEYCAVEASLAHLIPDQWDYCYAAGIPEALTTVYGTVFDLGGLKKGQTLLIHGAGSGIASLAIQMTKLKGAKVISTVGDIDKVDKAKTLGCDVVINHKEQDFVTLIPEQSIDLIVDFIGGDYFNKHLQLLKPKGQLIQISSIKGAKVDCNLALLMRKRLTVRGFVLRSQSLEEKARLWQLAHVHWYEALKSNLIKPIIDSEYSLESLDAAQAHMQTGKHFGKIVLRVF